MKTETDKKSILSGGHATGIGPVVIRDLVNVTWRMTVPTVLFIAIGYVIGRFLGNTTVGFLAGAVVGFAIGVYLALRLLKSVSKDAS